MGRGIKWNWGDSGGILSLVQVIRDHDRALEYDLMTRTGRTLSEYMDKGAAGMVALLSFINYLPADSALRSETDPQDEIGEWNTTRKTNIILADLFDVFVSANTKKGRKAKQYPRPKQKKKIGSGAIPISEFWDWWKGGEING